ncbi:peptidylprolyl isomerase [Ramlibacter sp.]
MGHKKSGVGGWRAGIIALGLIATVVSASAAPPTDAEIRAEYDRFTSLQGPYQYHVRHVLVASREQAQAIVEELRLNGDFLAVAKRASMDGSSRNAGGDLGWLGIRDVDPDFSAAMQKLAQGSVSEPVHTRFGWHVIRVDAVRPTRIPPFSQVRDQIAQGLQKRSEAQATPGAAELPAWTPQEWDLVFAAAQHTAGIRSFQYRAQMFTDLAAAQRASDFGLAVRNPVPVEKARNLLDVDPFLRMALSRLYLEGQTSSPLQRTDAAGGQAWMVVQLVASAPAAPLRADRQFQADAATWTRRGTLPRPAELAADTERARIAYFRAMTEDAVRAVPAGLSADVQFGNGSTPLLQAVLRKDLGLAKALVERGADVNRCGTFGCPLALAAQMEDEDTALAWVNWLLAADARVDGPDPHGATQFATALTGASWRGHLRVADALVVHHAAVDGLPGSPLHPVEAAALNARRDMVDWLVARHASLLPDPKRQGVRRTTFYTAALESKDEAFASWAEQAMLKEAAANPMYQLQLVFEQDGKVVKAVNGTVRLRARPFKMVLQLAPEADGVQVGASLDAAWMDEIRNGNPHNAMRRPFASGALQPADEPDSEDLLLSSRCPADLRADQDCDGVFMMLETDPALRNDFHERGPRPGRYARRVSTIVTPAAEVKAAPIERFAGRTLYLVLGQPLNVGGPAGLRLPNATQVKVEFTR